MNQEQLALEEKHIEEEKQKLDADRTALDERATAAEALDAQLSEMAAQKAALAAQIAGISAALGEGQGADEPAQFDEAKVSFFQIILPLHFIQSCSQFACPRGPETSFTIFSADRRQKGRC